MPWTLDDYPDSMKNLTKATKKKAIDIANALTNEGYKGEQAIPIAITQAKAWNKHASEDERKDYLQHGDVNKHDETNTSNPELLNQNEMVFFKKVNGLFNQKRRKKVSKLFDMKIDAINYAKKVAK